MFDFQHGVIGAGGDDDAGKIRLQQRQGIRDAEGRDHRIIGRVRAESVKAHRGLLVYLCVRRVVRQGAAATVVKPRAVQSPLRAVVGGFDTADGRIQRPARGDFEDVVGGLFRAALRESVDQMPPIPGGLINRQGIVRFALGAQGLRIDQHPRFGAPGALVVELFDIFTGLAAQIEHIAVVQFFDPGGAKRRAAIEFDQTLEQGAAIRQRGQNPLGVGRLPSKPGQDLGVGVIFEIPVGVLDLAPPMRLDNVVYPGYGRHRHRFTHGRVLFATLFTTLFAILFATLIRALPADRMRTAGRRYSFRALPLNKCFLCSAERSR